MNHGLLKNLKPVIRYGLWSELANLFRILNELLLMLVWFIALSEKQASWGESFLVLGMIYVGSYLFSRLLHSLKLKISLERLLFTLWILITVFLGLKFLFLANTSMTLDQFMSQIFLEDVSPETTFAFWVLLFSLMAMLRGVQLTRYPVSASDMTENFRWIIVIFAIFAVIFGHFQLEVFLPSFFVFLLSSLAGLSLARIADLSENNGGRLPGFNLRWAAGIGGTALGVIFLSLIFSLIINLDVAKLLGQGLTLLVQFISGALVVVASPLIWVVITIFQFLLKLISPNLENVLNENELDMGSQMLDDLQGEAANAVRIDPRLYAMIGVLLLLVLIAIIQLKWHPWRRELVGEEDSSQIETPLKKNNPLKNLFPSRGRIKRRSSAKSLFAAARIRFTYGQLMDLCEKMGKPRPRSVTPLEFLPRMDNLFPLNHVDLETITNAYIKIRYGELPETDRDVEEVLEAWKRISEAGKEFLEERARNLRHSKR
ncbi:MAG: DUF4129 domain-containing protein [Chloroflexi bacterium]|nr:DUF4129 domain-containing protein [Chloroflexota bacterium]